MADATRRGLGFAEFEMDRQALELYRDGQRVRLQIQPFRVLEILVERAGQVVTRDELRQRIWPSRVFVDFDHGLNNAVARLREALGDSADNPRFIETVPRVGYRFVFPAARVRGIGTADETAVEATADTSPMPGGEPAPDPAPLPAAKMHHRLARPGVAVLLVFSAIVAFTALYYSGSGQNDGAPPAIRSVAVLPVRDLSQDAGQEYLAAGMTEALVTRLAQTATLRVVSRRSGERYRDATVPIAEIARELGVDGIIDGSLSRDGDRLRIDVQLVRSADDTHAWARSYEGNVDNTFELQRQVAGDIATELGGDIGDQSASVAFSNNAEAYDLYLQGRHLWNQRSPDSVARGFACFEKAVELDADFAAAHAGIAESLALLGGRSLVKTMHNDEVREPALAAARRALELDERLPESHAAMARALGLQPRSAATNRLVEQHYLRALELNPAYSEARLGYGNYLSVRGRRDEAIAQFRLALLHDPLSPNNSSRLGKELVDAGNAEEGIPLLERAVEIEPWQFNAHIRLGWTYAGFGRFDDAMRSFDKAEQITPGTIHTLAAKAFVAARRGDRATAERLLESLHSQTDAIELPYLLAMVYVALEDRERALEWLEKAAPDMKSNARQGLYGFDGPLFDWLRGEPRFEQVVSSVASHQ